MVIKKDRDMRLYYDEIVSIKKLIFVNIYFSNYKSVNMIQR